MSKLNLCRWCTCRPINKELYIDFCSKECHEICGGHGCSLCNKNPGRVLGESEIGYCTDCCRKRLLEVGERCEKIKYRENQLDAGIV